MACGVNWGQTTSSNYSFVVIVRVTTSTCWPCHVVRKVQSHGRGSGSLFKGSWRVYVGATNRVIVWLLIEVRVSGILRTWRVRRKLSHKRRAEEAVSDLSNIDVLVSLSVSIIILRCWNWILQILLLRSSEWYLYLTPFADVCFIIICPIWDDRHLPCVGLRDRFPPFLHVNFMWLFDTRIRSSLSHSVFLYPLFNPRFNIL